MNIFYLHSDPKICAQMHLDKHVVKMIIEYGQLMSTAHRFLDGIGDRFKSANGRTVIRFTMQNPILEESLMKASHISHPCAIWTRANKSNYFWIYSLWFYLCKEYTYRYGKIHSVEKRLGDAISFAPSRIRTGSFYSPPLAMPDQCKILNDPIASYRKYYIEHKSSFAKWTKRDMPSWFSEGMKTIDLLSE